MHATYSVAVDAADIAYVYVAFRCVGATSFLLLNLLSTYTGSVCVERSSTDYLQE